MGLGQGRVKGGRQGIQKGKWRQLSGRLGTPSLLWVAVPTVHCAGSMLLPGFFLLLRGPQSSLSTGVGGTPQSAGSQKSWEHRSWMNHPSAPLAKQRNKDAGKALRTLEASESHLKLSWRSSIWACQLIDLSQKLLESHFTLPPCWS